MVYICQKMFDFLQTCSQQLSIVYTWQLIAIFLSHQNYVEWYKEIIVQYLKSLFQETYQPDTKILFWISYLDGLKSESSQAVISKITPLYINMFSKEYSKNSHKEEIIKQMTDLYIKGVFLIFKEALENREKLFILEILQK